MSEIIELPACKGAKPSHRWRMIAHLDGCHFYASTYVCDDCRATLHTSNERDLDADPYSAIWMDEEAHPEGEPCKRCRELMDGADVREPEISFEARP